VDPGNHVGAPSRASLTQPPYEIGPYQVLPNDSGWPVNGVIAGLDSDGRPLHLCTAYFADGMQPGKARVDWHTCDVSWGGGEHYVSSFYLLLPNYEAGQEGGSDPTCASGNALVCTSHLNPVPVGLDRAVSGGAYRDLDDSNLYSSNPDQILLRSHRYFSFPYD
jgi:hypothetical protein